MNLVLRSAWPHPFSLNLVFSRETIVKNISRWHSVSFLSPLLLRRPASRCKGSSFLPKGNRVRTLQWTEEEYALLDWSVCPGAPFIAKPKPILWTTRFAPRGNPADFIFAFSFHCLHLVGRGLLCGDATSLMKLKSLLRASWNYETRIIIGESLEPTQILNVIWEGDTPFHNWMTPLAWVLNGFDPFYDKCQVIRWFSFLFFLREFKQI